MMKATTVVLTLAAAVILATPLYAWDPIKDLVRKMPELSSEGPCGFAGCDTRVLTRVVRLAADRWAILNHHHPLRTPRPLPAISDQRRDLYQKAASAGLVLGFDRFKILKMQVPRTGCVGYPDDPPANGPFSVQVVYARGKAGNGWIECAAAATREQVRLMAPLVRMELVR